MKTVIALLEAAVVEYKRGTVAEGDNMLVTAMKLRNASNKAQKLVDEKTPTGKP